MVHVDTSPQHTDDTGTVYVWTVEPDDPDTPAATQTRRPQVALIVGTGHTFDGWAYMVHGSVIDPFVWHVLTRHQHPDPE